MSRSWNCKALIDRALDELWSSSTDTAMLARVINWANEIQNDLVSELPLPYFKIKLKKMLPTLQEFIDLAPQIPSTPTAAIAAGGSLTDGSTYKAYVTFLVYDEDGKKYIESEACEASAACLADAANKTVALTAIDLYDGDTSAEPNTIYRRVYLATLTSGSSAYGEPFFVQDIEDNTTTSLNITTAPTSTITPPSSSEIDQLTADIPYFYSAGWPLVRIDSNVIKRNTPTIQNSTSPSYFDFYGTQGIHLYPTLSTGSTTAQKTLLYTAHRLPHEMFYDVTREIDLPIVFKDALMAGLLWKGYEFRDREGAASKLNIYEARKKAARAKLKRQRGTPGHVRDMDGDVDGFEV